MINAKVKGFFNFAKLKDGKEEKLFEKESPNLILNSFLNAVNNGSYIAGSVESMFGSDIGQSVRAGGGATSPDPDDTGLETPLILTSATAVSNSSIVVDNDTGSVVQTRIVRAEFSPAVEILNLSEVAVYTNTAGTNLAAQPIVSRALITDDFGTPTVANIQIGEIFVVYYTFVCSFNAHLSFTKDIASTSTLIEAYMFSTTMNEFPWATTVCFNLEGHAIYSRSTNFTKPDLISSFYTISGWGTLQNNVVSNRTIINEDVGIKRKRRIGLLGANGTVKGIRSTINGNNNAGQWVFRFTPSFVKDNTKVLDLEFITTISRV